MENHFLPFLQAASLGTRLAHRKYITVIVPNDKRAVTQGGFVNELRAQTDRAQRPDDRDPVSPLSAEVAGFVSRTRFDDLPAGTVHAAERSLLDAVGVSLAAAAVGDGCRAFAELVIAEGGRADSTVLGHGARVPAAAAALANGAFAHAVDFEDAYDPAPSHPNAQAIPAVLAIAERDGLSGAQVVTAVAVGCDLTCRLARAVGSSLARFGWYPPPILGGLGAAAACANLLELDARQVLDALSIALNQLAASGEVMNSPESVVRAVRDAFPAQAAVRAAELAQRGVRGYGRPLDGHKGFFATFARGEWEPAHLSDDLGVRFAGEEVSFKPWPSCRGTHAFIEAALAARTTLRPEEIESVVLTGAPIVEMLAVPPAVKQAPRNAIDAKFSVQFCVATALETGSVTLDSFGADALRHPGVADLARRIEVVIDEDRGTPAGLGGGRLRLVLRDGSTREHFVAEPAGGPGNPIADASLREKFAACAAMAPRPMEPSELARAAGNLLALATIPNVRPVLAALGGEPAAVTGDARQNS
jgi:2-methylcitrate dehydratase PrpD